MEAREFDKRMQAAAEAAERALRNHMPAEAGLQRTVMEAMNYSLTAGGKRLRPVLMQETYRMCGGRDETLLGFFLAAIEMIHTYSLVHDDLPAMDNDRYRRGRKTTWCVYGDAMGILAGDGLLNYAFETALGAAGYCIREDGSYVDGKPADGGLSDGQRLGRLQRVYRALAVLARKAGIHGMIGGQVVDMEMERAAGSTEEELLFVHEHKTAALIQAAMMIGGILAGATEEQVADLEKCARDLGIAFQIQDDILDVEGDSEELGKPVGSDARNGKQTYVTLRGMARARTEVDALSREAVGILETFGGEQDFLRQLILNLAHRRK